MERSNDGDGVPAWVVRRRLERARRIAERPVINLRGEEALRRLFEVAHGDSGQCRRVARFLLGCYNGSRFPFDLADLRGLDGELFDDCMAVLKMDWYLDKEVHCYFPNGGEQFERLAEQWGLEDRSRS